MKSNLKLVGDPPPRTPERERLAEAIERREAATKRLAQLGDALECLESQSHDAVVALEAAERQQREAKRNEGHILAAVALGEIDANPLAKAERAITEANERLDALRKTRAALKAEIEREEHELYWADAGVARCTRTVLREDGAAFIERTLQEAGALRAELAAKRSVLSFLETAAFDWPSEMALSEPIKKFLTASWPDSSQDPTLARWRDVQEALATDPDAPLPV